VNKLRFILAFFGGFAVLSHLTAEAAPKAELWQRWVENNPASRNVVDHKEWSDFLNKYLVRRKDDPNLLRYEKVTPQDKVLLENYLSYLTRQTVSRHSRKQQLPFWINLYNALTVKVVLDHYPVDSILKINISPGFFSVGPWGKKLVTVEGEKISLDDIEHRILRPIWKDPRLHYVLNCASLGCPELWHQPYTGANVDRQMTLAAKAYINGSRGVWFDEGKLGASSLYKWYAEDFGGNDREIIEHLKNFAAPALRTRLDKVQDISVYHYDWSLNAAP